MTRLLLLGILALGLMTGIAVGQGKGHENDSVSVPEPSQAAAVLALLTGSTLIVRARRKK